MVHDTATCHLHAWLQFHVKVVRCLITLLMETILRILWKSLRFSPAETFSVPQSAWLISGLFIVVIVAAVAVTLWRLRWDIHEENVDSNKYEILWGVRLCFSFLPSGLKETADLRSFYDFHTCRNKLMHAMKFVNIWEMRNHLTAMQVVKGNNIEKRLSRCDHSGLRKKIILIYIHCYVTFNTCCKIIYCNVFSYHC